MIYTGQYFHSGPKKEAHISGGLLILTS